MHSASLQATETYSATKSPAPRVTLKGMEDRIHKITYINVGAATAALYGQRLADYDPLNLLTICVLTLDNGWTVLGKSAPASAENFDAEKGQLFAYEDAIRHLWPLEGYLLRNRLAEEQADRIAADADLARQAQAQAAATTAAAGVAK